MKKGKKQAGLSAKRRDVLFITVMLLPAILIVLWQIYYPVLRGIVMAFQNYNLYNLSKVKFIGLENFKELLTPSPFNSFIRTMKNTVCWVFGSLVPQFLIGFLIAMLLRRSFRGCGGNTQGVARLAEGRSVDEVIGILKGIRCGMKPTSCPDQLARALEMQKEG